MGDVPANAYICIDGHITEADDWDHQHAAAVGDEPPYDFTQLCRRMVWRPVDFVDQGDGNYHAKLGPGRSAGVAIVGTGGVQRLRCAKHVFPARKYPVLYSAFLLGGEDAIRAAMIDMLDQEDRSHGQKVKDQG